MSVATRVMDWWRRNCGVNGRHKERSAGLICTFGGAATEPAFTSISIEAQKYVRLKPC